MKNDDAAAIKSLCDYAIRFGQNRGLSPIFPSLVPAIGADFNGWPVRNTDGGAVVARFSSLDAAYSAINKARRSFRETFEVSK